MQPAARHCASRPNRAGGLRQTVRNERRTAVAWDERECRDPSARSSGNQSVPESACGPLRTVVVRVLAPRSVGRGRRHPPGAHGGAVSASLRLRCGGLPAPAFAVPTFAPERGQRPSATGRKRTVGSGIAPDNAASRRRFAQRQMLFTRNAVRWGEQHAQQNQDAHRECESESCHPGTHRAIQPNSERTAFEPAIGHGLGLDVHVCRRRPQ